MHSHQRKPEYQFDLSGGVLCLDFANTMSWRKSSDRSRDHLNSYDDLVAFAEQSTLLSPGQAGELRAQSRRRTDAHEIFRRTISFREVLFRAFSTLAAGKPVAPDDLQTINDLAARALGHRRLARANGRYRWEWQWDRTNNMGFILWRIAESTAELLTSTELAALRECQAAECGWLFLDHSRNHSRRWCDMKVCGNRQKARRHYQRTRS